ncbi:hypothetical protein AGMMS4952_13090 [Spirochaetia bacterium]|nr:hypothetical protein AGMMS4952_13090 [Spirochaetia bacterium]
MMRAVQAILLTAIMMAGAAALTLTGCKNPVNDDLPPKTAATPTANPAAGAINPAQTISLATDTGGAVIHYTIDGSVPSASSTAYTEPFTLPGFPATVKAIAVKTGWNDSAVLTAAYTKDENASVVVTALSLTSLVTAPVKGAPQNTTAINTVQYTGTIGWFENDGITAAPAVFAANTVYKAIVTLTVKTGFTFTGVAADSFAHTGATSVTNAANSGTVTITFPVTAAAGADTIINALSLDSLVIAPVKGAPQNTTAINTAQYTGTIGWFESNGITAAPAVFAANTVYKAIVTLTVKTGFTFTGVAADSFIYTGSTVSNTVNSGTVTVTFPATAAEGADTIINALSLDNLVTPPVKGVSQNTTAINTAQYTGTIGWFENDGTTAAPAVFAANTVYKAIVTLTVKTGYTFTGVGADSFAHTGATSVTNAANSGTVTITFPVTAAAGADTIINALSLDSLVIAPVKGATQNTTAINTAQYTGTIGWFENNGITAAPAAFAANRVYKAVVTLAAKPGFTFTGVTADSFTYSGATVTNAVDSGMVTITFPATAAAEHPAQETADAFTTTHAAILARTVGMVAIGDEAAVDAALAAYGLLSADAKALLTAEKTLLDNLKGKINELKANRIAADAFTTTHAAILAKTVGTAAIGDEAAVDAALAAYGLLSADATALLTTEKTLLDNLKAKINDLKADRIAADAFTTTHAAILVKTVGTAAIGDEAAVDAALAAYGLLNTDAKALLTAEKILLDNLKAKINELKANRIAADAFTTTYAAILAKTVGTAAIGDEAAVDAALAAYGLLSVDVKVLLTAEKTLLDSLKAKIEALIAATGATMTVNLWTNDTTILASPSSVTLSRSASHTALITGPSGAEYTNHQWSINGSDVAAPKGTAPTYTFNSPGKGNGIYYIGLQVKKGNAWYSKTITITVIN